MVRHPTNFGVAGGTLRGARAARIVLAVEQVADKRFRGGPSACSRASFTQIQKEQEGHNCGEYADRKANNEEIGLRDLMPLWLRLPFLTRCRAMR